MQNLYKVSVSGSYFVLAETETLAGDSLQYKNMTDCGLVDKTVVKVEEKDLSIDDKYQTYSVITEVQFLNTDNGKKVYNYLEDQLNARLLLVDLKAEDLANAELLSQVTELKNQLANTNKELEALKQTVKDLPHARVRYTAWNTKPAEEIDVDLNFDDIQADENGNFKPIQVEFKPKCSKPEPAVHCGEKKRTFPFMNSKR